MIKAELSYNPYLLTTKVKFNGQEPKINCQIEKYEKKPLKDWVDKVPEIFYSEMNGYDFDLYFTGTIPDFLDLQYAFGEKGITYEQVRLIHKNELEDPDTKSLELENLLEWLRKHPNRQFDFEEFWNQNAELFEGVYPYIIVNGNCVDKLGKSISVENTDNVNELVNTNLASTPILFCIEKGKTMQFREDLNWILGRKEVHQEQLFFMIDPLLNEQQVTRVISDLGVVNPQVITKYDDRLVYEYLRNYPVTEYIRDAIKVVSSTIKKLDVSIKEKNKANEIANVETYRKLDDLEVQMGLLKRADECFVEHDNYMSPIKFEEIKKQLSDQILRWKNRKTKITGENEAEIALKEYNDYICRAISVFNEEMSKVYTNEENRIKNEFASIYEGAHSSVFFPKDIILEKYKDISFEGITPEYLELYVMADAQDPRAFFGLFINTSNEDVPAAQVKTYYLERWREKAVGELMPMANEVIADSCKALTDFYYALADCYHEHLQYMLREKTDERDACSAQLSDDERKLQEDNNWLSEFNDRLQQIERG